MAVIQGLEDNNQNIEYFNPSLFAQLLRVSKISLWVGLSGILIVSLIIVLILPAMPEDYADFIQYMSRVQHDLPLMLGISAMLLIAFAGFIVWVICVYSSFRIAGPLYRFARNLEDQITLGPRQVMQIRQEDRLQGECRLLNQTIANLLRFYSDLNGANERLLHEMGTKSPASKPAELSALQVHLQTMLKLLASVKV